MRLLIQFQNKQKLRNIHPAKTTGSPPRGQNSNPAVKTNSLKFAWVASLTRCPYSCNSNSVNKLAQTKLYFISYDNKQSETKSKQEISHHGIPASQTRLASYKKQRVFIAEETTALLIHLPLNGGTPLVQGGPPLTEDLSKRRVLNRNSK